MVSFYRSGRPARHAGYDRNVRRTLVLLTLALLLVPAALARADAAYERVAAAYAEAGGHLDPCAFTQAQLQAGLDGIPEQIKDVVPDLRKAIQDGIAAHARGECEGREPGTTTNPDTSVGSGAVPPVTTTPVTPTAPATGSGTEPAQTAPPAGAPATTTTPAPSESAPPAAAQPAGPRTDDRDALVIALVVLGALLLLVLAIWGWARLRGWDPSWATRARHAWGEAGFRTTTTWSEFTDWLRLGR